MAADFSLASASGLQPVAEAAVPSTVVSIVSGLTQDQLPEFDATPKGAPPRRQWMLSSSVGAGPPSVKRRITLPQNIPQWQKAQERFSTEHGQ